MITLAVVSVSASLFHAGSPQDVAVNWSAQATRNPTLLDKAGLFSTLLRKQGTESSDMKKPFCVTQACFPTAYNVNTYMSACVRSSSRIRSTVPFADVCIRHFSANAGYKNGDTQPHTHTYTQCAHVLANPHRP